MIATCTQGPKLASDFKRQTGVALITAVLIVALITVAATAMATRQMLDIRRTENIMHSEQAYAYALAAESLAGRVLVDFDQDKNVDYLGEDWAKAGMIPIPMRGGSVTVSISDASGSFPINNLVDEGGARRDPFYNALHKLIDTVLADSFAPELPAAIMDWVDPNLDLTAGGAEDLDYLNKKPFAYRAANQPISSVSELRLVSGMLPDDYIKLVPRDGRPAFINALPIESTININTAPKEVIMSLHEKIDTQIADEIIATREEKVAKGEAPYKDVDKFIEYIGDSVFPGVPQGPAVQDKQNLIAALKQMKLSVNSQYFEVTALATVGRTEVQLHSLLKRDNNQIIVMRRGIGVY